MMTIIVRALDQGSLILEKTVTPQFADMDISSDYVRDVMIPLPKAVLTEASMESFILRIQRNLCKSRCFTVAFDFLSLRRKSNKEGERRVLPLLLSLKIKPFAIVLLLTKMFFNL